MPLRGRPWAPVQAELQRHVGVSNASPAESANVNTSHGDIKPPMVKTARSRAMPIIHVSMARTNLRRSKISPADGERCQESGRYHYLSKGKRSEEEPRYRISQKSLHRISFLLDQNAVFHPDDVRHDPVRRKPHAREATMHGHVVSFGKET
jgi:hypothetical protein